jgi:hypothetical protein
MAETRKLAAILAADVAGYSRLAAAYPKAFLSVFFPHPSTTAGFAANLNI